MRRDLPVLAFVSEVDGQAVERELARLDAFYIVGRGDELRRRGRLRCEREPARSRACRGAPAPDAQAHPGRALDVAPVRVRLGGPARRTMAPRSPRSPRGSPRAPRRRRARAGRGGDGAARAHPRRSPRATRSDSSITTATPRWSRSRGSRGPAVRGARRHGGGADPQRVRRAREPHADARDGPRRDGIGKSRLAAALHRAIAQTVPARPVLALRGQAGDGERGRDAPRAPAAACCRRAARPARPPEPASACRRRWARRGRRWR